MAFHDVRFPECIEIGATGGPRFKTTVLALGSGHEKRNIEWARVRCAWDIGSGVKTKEDMESVIAFFYARQGQAHGFRFRDWNDWHIGDAETPLTIGTGTGVETHFQLVKRYTSGGINFDRKITRPVASTIVVSTNESPTLNYSVNYSTGLVTFQVPPDNGTTIKAYGQFDVPVRFSQDSLDIVGLFDTVQEIPAIGILEIRE